MDSETLALFQQFQTSNEAIYDWNDIQFETLISMMNIVEFKEYETLINIGEEASWFGFLLQDSNLYVDHYLIHHMYQLVVLLPFPI